MPSGGSPSEPAGTLVTDREGVIVRWEDDCATVFGHSPQDALGRTLDLVVPPALQARHWRGFGRAVASGELKRPGKTLRLPAIHKDGRVISLQIDDAKLVKDRDGTVVEVSVRPSRGPGWIAAASRPVLAILNLGRRFSRLR